MPITLSIIDAENLDKETLVLTAEYLMNLAEKRPVKSELIFRNPGDTLQEDPDYMCNTYPSNVAADTPCQPNHQFENLNPANFELDIDGKQWDEAIHSRTKSKTADGRWKLKRGLDVKAAPLPPIAPFVAPPVVSSATTPVVAPAAPVVPSLTFPEIMARITSAISANRLSRDQVLGMVKEVGLTEIPQLAEPQNAALLPSINNLLDAALNGGM